MLYYANKTINLHICKRYNPIYDIMKRITLLFLFLGAIATNMNAQQQWKKKSIKAKPPVCYASDEVHRVFIPPSPDMLLKLKSGTEPKSNIIVNYSLFPEEAKKAFEYAVGLWELIIDSPIPIYIQANWRTQDENVLGSCAPADYYDNFDGAPHKNLLYPISVVEKITNQEITGASAPDINADFNKNIKWYFGTDGSTPDSLYDFVTVVMHELGHGLGFTGFFYATDSLGTYAYLNLGEASSFDRLVIKRNGDRLLDTLLFPNPSQELEKALTSNNIYANSPAVITDVGSTPRLYAPYNWSDGSSIYHLNDVTYPSGTPNSLMTHAIGIGEAIHDPGPITKGIMADIGWKNMTLKFTPVKDIEQIKPLTFNIEIESDYELDTASLYVVLSTDSFLTQPDTLPLHVTNEPNVFTMEFLPPEGTENIHYYMNTGDIKNRIFRLPTNAPDSLYTITIGPDNILPTIAHKPIAYYLLNGDDLKITAEIDDNLGVDTAYVAYSINGEEHPPFGLSIDSETTYTGIFNFDKGTLKDGDLISYKIIARDSSVAQNTATLPDDSSFYFNIDGIFSPKIRYENYFDNITTDFILTDFDVYTDDGFDSGALQSPHPYPSPKQPRTNYNFSTILKQLIVLQDSGTMDYDEVVLVEPGEALTNFGDENFWDYVIVEGSKDSARTWLPLINGYDSNDNTTWKSKYNSLIVGQNSKATGSPDLYIKRQIKLSGNGNFSPGDTILIRFRLFSDPYANGWGWAIDNLRIQVPLSAKLTTLSPGNINIFPNPFGESFYVSIHPQKPVSDIEINVFNMFGQKLGTRLLDNIYGLTKERISLQQAGPGIYFVVVKENGQPVYSKKIIKKE